MSAVVVGVGTGGGMAGWIWVEPGHCRGDKTMRKRKRGTLGCIGDFSEHLRYW